ncbi:MAG: diguanylate cyclase [Emcibacter sp.]|nr:diguanylate cyclase [Emcibacter sp.]
MTKISERIVFYPVAIFFTLTILGLAGALYTTNLQENLTQESFFSSARNRASNLASKLKLHMKNKPLQEIFTLNDIPSNQTNYITDPDFHIYIIDNTSVTPEIYDLNNHKIMLENSAIQLINNQHDLNYRERVTTDPKQLELLIIPNSDKFKTDYNLAIFIQVIGLFMGALFAFMLRQSLRRTIELRKEIYNRISEMKEYLQIKEEAEENNKLLNIVMDTFPHGICAFAPDMTLLKWNNNLLTILDLPTASIKKGILYKVLTKHLDQISYFPPSTDNHSISPTEITEDSFIKQDISFFERNLQDGRTLEVSLIPMSNGGFIVVYSDITQRKKAERVIRHMAHFDSLTGLANRAYFSDKLDGLLNHNRQGDNNLALALIDLDKFKFVNDTYGHPMGDALLQRVAEILKNQIRDNDFAARIGGDEFAVLFTNINDASEVLIPLNRMIDRLNKPISIRGTNLDIGASIGVAIYPDHGLTSEILTKVADKALYKAKENGRGRIEVAPIIKEAKTKIYIVMK